MSYIQTQEEEHNRWTTYSLCFETAFDQIWTEETVYKRCLIVFQRTTEIIFHTLYVLLVYEVCQILVTRLIHSRDHHPFSIHVIICVKLSSANSESSAWVCV